MYIQRISRYHPALSSESVKPDVDRDHRKDRLRQVVRRFEWTTKRRDVRPVSPNICQHASGPRPVRSAYTAVLGQAADAKALARVS